MSINTVNSALRIAMTSGRFALSEIQEAIAYLRSLGQDAHVYLPGVGILNGLTAANFIDSAGTQAGVVDSIVGRVNDAMGVVGAPFGNPQAVVIPAFGVVASTTALIVGKSYWLTLSANVGMVGTCQIDTLPATAVSSGQSKTIFLAATSTSLSIRDTSTGTVGTITLSATEISGIHASQTTTGSKPILRRGAVNLLTYSQDFTNAAWSKSGGAVSIASTTLPDGSAGSVSLFTVAATNALHRITDNWTHPSSGSSGSILIELKSNGIRYIYINTGATLGSGAVIDLQTGGITGTGASISGLTALDIGNGWFRVSYSGVSTTVNCSVLLQANDTYTAGDRTFLGDGIAGFFMRTCGAFQGTYTAQQLQSLGGIPLTTTAPASTALGPYFWQFDGSNDSLQLGGVPFSQTDDRVVVAGFQSTKASGASTIFDVSNSAMSGTPIAARLEQDSTGLLHAYFRDNSGSLVDISYNTGAYTPVVASIRVAAGSRMLRTNGVQRGVNASALGTTTVTTSCIGISAANSAATSGAIYPILAIKGTVSDANLLLLEKLVANMSGVTI